MIFSIFPLLNQLSGVADKASQAAAPSMNQVVGGMFVLFLSRLAMNVVSAMVAIFFVIGVIILIDKIFLKKIDTIEEIKGDNWAVGIVIAAIIIGFSSLLGSLM